MNDTLSSFLNYHDVTQSTRHFLDELEFEDVDVLILNERRLKVNGKLTKKDESIIDASTRRTSGVCDVLGNKYAFYANKVKKFDVITYSIV